MLSYQGETQCQISWGSSTTESWFSLPMDGALVAVGLLLCSYNESCCGVITHASNG